jgi:predicted dehydrogenase
MSTGLRAVVVGAGFAGEGHTRAFGQAGIDVVAICARDAAVVRDVARRLEVPEASTNWRETIERARPDIVCLATPAALRAEVVKLSAGLGCHIYCEKPLAVTADEAKRLVEIVEGAGVKHAFALTHAVHPTVSWVRDLVRAGAIGPVRSFDVAFHLGQLFPPLAPWTWVDSIALGGGVLNNFFSHTLSMLETMLDRPTTRVVGSAQGGRTRAPVVPGVHDFRTFAASAPTEAVAQSLEWRDCDADWSVSALAAVRGWWPAPDNSPEGPEVIGHLTISTNFRLAWPPNGWRLHGENGVLLVDQPFAPIEVFRLRPGDSDREQMPIPPELLEAAPNSGDHLVDMWTIIAQRFVADIRGEPHDPYPSFYDGLRVQAAIDAIRSGAGWATLPSRSPSASPLRA